MTGGAVLTGMFSVTQAFVSRSATKTTTATAATRARRRGLTGKSYGLCRDHSSVDDEDLTGDVARLVRGKEGDRVRDVLDRAEPPERDLLEEVVFDLLGKRIGEIGRDEPGSHGVGRDVSTGHFARDRLGEPDDAGLRGRVGGLSGIPDDAGDRGDVRAFAREAYRGGTSDPATAPGDERGPTLELHAAPKLAGPPLSGGTAPSAIASPSA